MGSWGAGAGNLKVGADPAALDDADAAGAATAWRATAATMNASPSMVMKLYGMSRAEFIPSVVPSDIEERFVPSNATTIEEQINGQNDGPIKEGSRVAYEECTKAASAPQRSRPAVGLIYYFL